MNTITIFLTSGVTIKLKEDECFYVDGTEHTLEEMYVLLNQNTSKTLMFEQELEHENQKVKHSFTIPTDKISWFMLEEIL